MVSPILDGHVRTNLDVAVSHLISLLVLATDLWLACHFSWPPTACDDARLAVEGADEVFGDHGWGWELADDHFWSHGLGVLVVVQVVGWGAAFWAGRGRQPTADEPPPGER